MRNKEASMDKNLMRKFPKMGKLNEKVEKLENEIQVEVKEGKSTEVIFDFSVPQ